MELPRLARPKGVSPYATYGARRAVWTHYGPTWIHLADYSLRHRRDGSAGTTILLSSPHQPPPALVLSDDCGPPGAVGAAGPFEGLRAGTEQRAD